MYASKLVSSEHLRSALLSNVRVCVLHQLGQYLLIMMNGIPPFWCQVRMCKYLPPSGQFLSQTIAASFWNQNPYGYKIHLKEKNQAEIVRSGRLKNFRRYWHWGSPSASREVPDLSNLSL